MDFIIPAWLILSLCICFNFQIKFYSQVSQPIQTTIVVNKPINLTAIDSVLGGNRKIKFISLDTYTNKPVITFGFELDSTWYKMVSIPPEHVNLSVIPDTVPEYVKFDYSNIYVPEQWRYAIRSANLYIHASTILTGVQDEGDYSYSF